MAEMDNIIQQKIIEIIFKIRRKNHRRDTDVIYKELIVLQTLLLMTLKAK